MQPLLAKTSYKAVDAKVIRSFAVSHILINFASCEQQEFMRLLLPILSRRLRRTVPSMLEHPSLLAHTINQALSFDTKLRENGFSPEADAHVQGISDVILGNVDWFEAWLEGERRCKPIPLRSLIVLRNFHFHLQSRKTSTTPALAHATHG